MITRTIDSPRSRKACQTLGIMPSDLVMPTDHELRQRFAVEKKSAIQNFDMYKDYFQQRIQKKLSLVNKVCKLSGPRPEKQKRGEKVYLEA